MKKLTILALCIFYTITGLNATVWYVKSDGTEAKDAANATSWETACSDLQAVINHSNPGDEIWVAAGTYEPNRNVTALQVIDKGNPDNAFVLKGNVKLYGGFPANVNNQTGNRLDSRNPKVNQTLLSGHLNNDKKAYHVVVAVADRGETLHLDGFTITGGNARGEGSLYVKGLPVERHSGGGVTALTHKNSQIILTGNTFMDNAAEYGGGVSSIASVPGAGTIDLTGNLFEDNSAEYGGGIYVFSGGDAKTTALTLTRNTLSNNEADYGGGIYAVTFLGGEITISGNTVSNNLAHITGGGLSAGTYYGGNIVLENGTFTHNSAGENGSGVFVHSEIGSVSIVNSMIGNNVNSKNLASVLRHDGTLNVSDCQIGDLNLPDGTKGKGNRLAQN
ncbi:MAG: hypothetical protein LBO74_11425 [Candidatus Symbiothrix sp.]|jgi:hypothetical protein|nr:hypothetical protein [Candidatus Symbiothrix sp.]